MVGQKQFRFLEITKHEYRNPWQAQPYNLDRIGQQQFAFLVESLKQNKTLLRCSLSSNYPSAGVPILKDFADTLFSVLYMNILSKYVPWAMHERTLPTPCRSMSSLSMMVSIFFINILYQCSLSMFFINVLYQCFLSMFFINAFYQCSLSMFFPSRHEICISHPRP